MENQRQGWEVSIHIDPAILHGLAEFQAGMARVTKQLQTQMEGIERAFQESCVPMLAQFAELAVMAKRFEQEGPARVMAVQQHFASLGWHASDLIPFSAFTLLTPSSSPEEVDSYFLAFHEQEIQTIEETLFELYSSRRPLLSLAFQAHRNRQYELAIPVFLAQAEGIVMDSLGPEVKLFTSDQRKLKRQWSQLESLPLSFLTRAMVDIVRQGLPMGAGEFRSNFPHCLNRNAILHGEDLEYGTELNSHKAISLLTFVATTMPDIARAIKETKNNSRDSSGV